MRSAPRHVGVPRSALWGDLVYEARPGLALADGMHQGGQARAPDAEELVEMLRAFPTCRTRRRDVAGTRRAASAVRKGSFSGRRCPRTHTSKVVFDWGVVGSPRARHGLVNDPRPVQRRDPIALP
jgi:hypothetical protein